MTEDVEMKDSSKTNEKEEPKEEALSKEEQEKLILEGKKILF